MKKISLYIVIGVLVLGSAGYFVLNKSNGKDVKYRTEKISRGNVSLQVRATGTINPMQTVRVGSQVSGTIAKLNVDFNSSVKKGDIIAVIDSTFLYASVKEAQANLERNQAQVNEAKRSYNRTSELFKKSLVSQADLDAAQTGYESAVAQLKQSQAALDRVNVNLRYSVIRAPIDGVVISRDVDVGQTVAASLQAPQLFSIANDLQHMQVEASVDEADIGQIQQDQPATFTVDAYPEMQFRGTVTQVRLAPITVQNVVTYTVIIEVPNPDLKLRPGMTATVSMMVDDRQNVLRVPALALRFQPPLDVAEKAGEQKDSATQRQERSGKQAMTDQGGERRDWRRMRRESSDDRPHEMPRVKMANVWILQNGSQLKQVAVKLGLNDNRYIEILGGELNEGDEVIIGSTGPDVANATNQQQNPFAPRMPMGGGRGMR